MGESRGGGYTYTHRRAKKGGAGVGFAVFGFRQGPLARVLYSARLALALALAIEAPRHGQAASARQTKGWPYALKQAAVLVSLRQIRPSVITAKKTVLTLACQAAILRS